MKSMNTDPIICFFVKCVLSCFSKFSLVNSAATLLKFCLFLGNSLSAMGSIHFKSIHTNSLYVVHSKEIGQ